MIEFDPRKAMLSSDAPWWKRALSRVGDAASWLEYKIDSIVGDKPKWNPDPSLIVTTTSADAFVAASDNYNFPVTIQFECDHSAKCPTCVWVAPFYMNSRHPFALEVPAGGWPDDGIRSCGACGAGWTATEKCSHEKQKT